jgi:hypothetical protein
MSKKNKLINRTLKSGQLGDETDGNQMDSMPQVQMPGTLQALQLWQAAMSGMSGGPVVVPARTAFQGQLVYLMPASSVGAGFALQQTENDVWPTEAIKNDAQAQLGENPQQRYSDSSNGNNTKTSKKKFKAQFTKTSLCKFHLAGNCKKGPLCLFAHDTDELVARPDLTNTKLCRNQLNYGRCDDPECNYAHSPDELRDDQPELSTQRCDKPLAELRVHNKELQQDCYASRTTSLAGQFPSQCGLEALDEQDFQAEMQPFDSCHSPDVEIFSEDQHNIADLIEVLSQLEPLDKATSVSVALAQDDNPLVFVSECFQEMTGHPASTCLGRNCRFLNERVGMSTTNRVGIREAIVSGKRFTAILLNERKNGCVFTNLLDLLSLEIGVHVSGRPVRLLVGIQGNCDTHESLCYHLGRSNHVLRTFLKRFKSLCLEQSCRRVLCRTLKLSRLHTHPFWVDRSISETLFRWPSPEAGLDTPVQQYQEDLNGHCKDLNDWADHIQEETDMTSRQYPDSAEAWADMIDEPFS